ncbi:MAG: PQQ-binding-like beta-propeller repeat protein [Armatimonadetes bacterium]|nr:PQQ-binding-like beta-propeller repeat protein [Armatimonadota bacterium]
MGYRLLNTFAALLCLALAANAQGVMGWRTDGTGRYPAATPPLTWSAEQGVVWATPTPAHSNSTPLLVGDLVFVTSEPTTLLCLRATDGALLWAKPNDFSELASEQEAAQMTADYERAAKLRQEAGQTWGEVRKLKQDLQDSPDDADLKAKLAEAEKKMADINAELQAYREKWYSLPDAHPTNGYASATPVSDGSRVFAVFGTGMVVAYDLYGTRLWHRVLAKPTIDWGGASSPVLVGEKLIVQSRDVYALNKDTGETLWQVQTPETWATPMVTTVSNEPVLLTGAGDAIRVSDGAILASNLGRCDYGSGIVEGDVAYWIQNGGTAVRLREIADDKLLTETLWTTTPKADRYYAAPLLYDGLIYCITQSGVFSVIDAADGAVVFEKDLQLGQGTVYPSICLAGGNLYVSSDNGTTVVLKPGREPVELARNTLEGFRSTPVFSGSRVYIRGLTKVWCLGE